MSDDSLFATLNQPVVESACRGRRTVSST